MTFREALDSLCDKVGHVDVADALGVSVQAVRQARLNGETKAKRRPPEEWEDAVIRLAEKRVWHYRKLIEQVRMAQKSEGDNGN